MKLSRKILAATIIPFIVVIGLFNHLTTTIFNEYLADVFQRQAENRLNRAEGDILDFLHNSEAQLNLLATIVPPSQKDIVSAEIALSGVLQKFEEFFQISAINIKGHEWIRINKFPTSDKDQKKSYLFNSPIYQQPTLKLTSYFGNIHSEEDFPLPFFSVSVPVQNRKTGEVSGVLAAEISFQHIQSILERYLPNQGSIILASTKEATIITKADDTNKDLTAVENLVIKKSSSQEERHGRIEQLTKGDKAIFMYRKFSLEELHFTILYYQPPETIYFLADQLKRYNIIVTIGGIISFFLISVMLLKLIITPLSQITKRISALGLDYSNGTSANKPVNSNINEVDQLRHAFSFLQTQLSSYRKKVEDFSKTLKEEVRDKTQKLDKTNIALMQANKDLKNDIEHRKQIELEKQKLNWQLQQAQKMEAVGTLAGGIAHDFNNILTAIIGYTELVKLKIPTGHKLSNDVEEILNACNRAKNLVKQILTFSRQKTDSELSTIQLYPVVKEALKLLRASIPSTITIKEHIQEDNNTVLADPTKIHQILMNLCTNAYQAMKEEIGILSVDLEKTVVPMNKNIADQSPLPPGSYIKLEVRDTGRGMDEDTLTRIFDPYFTTKSKEGGSGMGLSVVHGIVQSHHGHILAQSTPGIGSAFQVYLPIIQSTSQSSYTESSDDTERGNERILLIDDEDIIVQLETRILANLGYRISSFNNSQQALKKFSAAPDDFDLVITDMTMPQMTGAELAKKILSIKPDIPIILCTGYSELISESKAKEIGIREYVTKPITRKKIAAVVRRVLDNKE